VNRPRRQRQIDTKADQHGVAQGPASSQPQKETMSTSDAKGTVILASTLRKVRRAKRRTSDGVPGCMRASLSSRGIFAHRASRRAGLGIVESSQCGDEEP